MAWAWCLPTGFQTPLTYFVSPVASVRTVVADRPHRAGTSMSSISPFCSFTASYGTTKLARRSTAKIGRSVRRLVRQHKGLELIARGP